MLSPGASSLRALGRPPGYRGGPRSRGPGCICFGHRHKRRGTEEPDDFKIREKLFTESGAQISHVEWPPKRQERDWSLREALPLGHQGLCVSRPPTLRETSFSANGEPASPIGLPTFLPSGGCCEACTDVLTGLAAILTFLRGSRSRRRSASLLSRCSSLALCLC